MRDERITFVFRNYIESNSMPGKHRDDFLTSTLQTVIRSYDPNSSLLPTKRKDLVTGDELKSLLARNGITKHDLLLLNYLIMFPSHYKNIESMKEDGDSVTFSNEINWDETKLSWPFLAQFVGNDQWKKKKKHYGGILKQLFLSVKHRCGID